MRVLITTVGSHGDVHPYLAVGRALRARGHEVAFGVQPYFAEQVKRAGLEYVPMGEAFDLAELSNRPELMNGPLASFRIMRQLIIPESANVTKLVERRHAERPIDVLFTHHICFGTPWAGEKLGIPCVTACLTPIVWASVEDPGASHPGLRPKPNSLAARFHIFLGRHMCRWFFDGPLNRARREVGLPKQKGGFLKPAREAVSVLGLWSRHFRVPRDTDPETARTCGFAIFDRHMPDEAALGEVEAFLSAGDPPIVFTLGSSAVHVPGRFYEDAAEACRLLGRRGLLLAGPFAPKRLPPGVAAFRYAPHSLVMPRGCATVHHGGVGTTAQSLRAGKPIVIVPFAHDQFDNATRVTALGVGAELARKRVSAATLAQTLRSLLENPEVVRKAAEIGRAISAEDGAEAAADEIERVGAGAPRASPERLARATKITLATASAPGAAASLP